MKVWRFDSPIEWLDQRYRLEGILGSGGMADVCLAWDTEQEREVAIKLIKADELDQPTLDRFVQEASHLAELDHPNILRLYSELKLELLGGTPGAMVPYLVMEFAQGGDLNKRLQTGRPFPLPDTLLLFSQLCRAVGYAHKQGVIHRDLKPSNILFRRLPDGAEQVLLSDFGLAVRVDASHQSFKYGGTFSYMAPEQMRGQAIPASDIFALGVILYRLCTGMLPFEHSMTQLGDHDVYRLPLAPSKRAPDLPRGLDRVILGALAADPQQRFGSVEDLWEAVSGAVSALRLSEMQQEKKTYVSSEQGVAVSAGKGARSGEKRIAEVKPVRPDMAQKRSTEISGRQDSEREEDTLTDASPTRAFSVRIYLDTTNPSPSAAARTSTRESGDREQASRRDSSEKEPHKSLGAADETQQKLPLPKDLTIPSVPKGILQEPERAISDEFDLSLMRLPVQLKTGDGGEHKPREESKQGESSAKRVFPARTWQLSSTVKEKIDTGAHTLTQIWSQPRSAHALAPTASETTVQDLVQISEGEGVWNAGRVETPMFSGRAASGRKKVWLGLSLVLVCALVLGGIFATRETPLPAAGAVATVIIAPVSKTVTDHYAVTMVPDKADPAKQQVSAQPVTSTQQTMTTVVTGTGHIQTPGARALGSLDFYNSASVQQTIHGGTIFTGADGVQVTIDFDFFIPAATPGNNPYELEVFAHPVKDGAAGNIAAGDINQKCCNPNGAITVKNLFAYTDGKDARDYQFVRPEDVTAAVAPLKQEVAAKASTALSQQMQSGEVLAPGSQCTSTTQTDQPIGDQGRAIPSLTATVSASCTGLMYDLRPLQDVTRQRLQAKADQELGSDYSLQGDISFKVLEPPSKSYQQTMLQVAVEGRYVAKIDARRKAALTNLIAGKSPSDARTLLEQQGDIKVIALPQNSLPPVGAQIYILVRQSPASTA